MPEVLENNNPILPNMGGKIKGLFVDCDGTLLDHHQQRVPKANLESLASLQRQGVRCMLATGRTMPSTMKSIEASAVRHGDERVLDPYPGVYLQGNVVYDTDGSLLVCNRLGLDVVRTVGSLALSYGAECGFICLCHDGTGYTNEVNDLVLLMAKYNDPVPTVTPLEDDCVKDTVKVLLIMKDKQCADKIRGELHASGVGDAAEITSAISEIVEVLPKGSSKGQGCLTLMNHLGLQRDEIMAIGDAENDTYMLQSFPMSVAMGNATEAVKKHASFVTTSVEEAGVANAIRMMF
eukprot:GHVO01043827.1.p1 GENE.GHVO01043827.1~~GHVO01043827.1.p1  ORF type:complete len:302 (-),score=60.40 GHVO01043827.1:88-966(-)